MSEKMHSEAEIQEDPMKMDRRVRLTLRPTSLGKLVGRSAKLIEIMRTIDRVARSSCTVLITGESGTGKEMVVGALHDASTRTAQPLVTVNCGAIPENLIESELFGHAKGSFTGAHVARHGRVAAAEGGTLFLDEVGELPLALQVKLLRLLQQREYSPVGDSRTQHCDIRVVAATNRNLEAEILAGRFREDLFYRLNVIHIHLPPLRERREDIEPLATHFFRLCCERAGRDDLRGFTPQAMQLLMEHDWPGNIRALENIVERIVLLAPGPMIDVIDLPIRARKEANHDELTPDTSSDEIDLAALLPSTLPLDGIDLRAVVEEYESKLIRQALERTGWNKNRAAQLLGLNRTTLVEMVKRKKLAAM